MSFQVGRGCLPLIITRQRLSDTRRRLSVQLGPRRGHESAWCLLGFAGGNHADRAGFCHVFSYPRCLFSRYPRLHDTLIQQRVSSAPYRSFKPRERRRTDVIGGRCHCTREAISTPGSPELPSSPASQEPSRPVTASQSRADVLRQKPYQQVSIPRQSRGLRLALAKQLREQFPLWMLASEQAIFAVPSQA